VNPLRSTDEFLTVGYTGTLSEEYDLSGFLIAISEIATKQPKNKTKFHRKYQYTLERKASKS
jgi:hypothetical protein